MKTKKFNPTVVSIIKRMNSTFEDCPEDINVAREAYQKAKFEYDQLRFRKSRELPLKEGTLLPLLPNRQTVVTKVEYAPDTLLPTGFGNYQVYVATFDKVSGRRISQERILWLSEIEYHEHA